MSLPEMPVVVARSRSDVVDDIKRQWTMSGLAAFAAQIPPGCVCAEIDPSDRPCLSCETEAVLEAAPRAPEQR